MRDVAEVVDKFGVNPETIGHRPRGWWILDTIEDGEFEGNAQLGYLCVKTRDGGGNPMNVDALKIPNCVGTSEDSFDRTYRYYYYKPLEDMES